MSSELLQLHLGSSPDPAVLMTPDGAIEWYNAAFAARFNGSPELSPGDARAILGTLRYAVVDDLETPTLKELTAIVVAVDGSAMDAERFLILFKVRDPRMRSLNEREEFLGTVAHDIKNPIGAVFGYADALLDTPLGDSLLPAQRQVIQKIRGTATRAIDLVRNYQHLAALQSGRSPLFKGLSATVDLNQTIRNVIEYSTIEEGHTAAVKAVLTTQPLQVKIERVALERIVANLLSNALKFTPPSGVVSLTTEISGARASLEIANSEPLLSTDDLQHLFEKYWRGSGGNKIPGSGLGLYIVKLLCENAGGTIAVRSNEREGNVFRVELPAAV